MFELNTTIFPNRFEGPLVSNANVTFDIQLPTYFSDILGIRIFDNLKIVDNLLLYFREKNTTSWIPLTKKNLLERNGKKNNLEIRISSPNVGIEEGTTGFTHVDIIFKMANFPRGDMPNLNISENFDNYEALINTNMELSAEIPYLDRGCIIGENRQGLMWKVIGSTVGKTNVSQLFCNTVDIRLIQSYEQLALLNLNNRVDVVKNFQKLVSKQGIYDK